MLQYSALVVSEVPRSAMENRHIPRSSPCTVIFGSTMSTVPVDTGGTAAFSSEHTVGVKIVTSHGPFGGLQTGAPP